MSPLLNFTRGGQVQFHGIHMFYQVLVKLIRISLLLFMLSFVLLFFFLTTNYEKISLVQWSKANLCKNNPACSTIRLRDVQGRQFSISAKQLLRSPSFSRTIQNVQKTTLLALKLSGFGCFSLSILIALWLARYGALRNQHQHTKGAYLATSKTFKRLIRQERMASRWTLGGVPLPKEAETQHILICGSPGGGKSVCTLELLDQVRKSGQRAIIYDIKGAFIPHFYRSEKDIILNPLDARSPSWNLWEECSHLSDYDSFAAAIVPDSSRGTDNFWLKAARTLLAISATQFKKNTAPHMQNFMEHLFCGDLKNIEDLLKGTLGSSLVGKDLEKGTKSILLTLVTYCKSLMYIKDEKENPSFIIREWVHNENTDSWLFISSNQRLAETLKPIISLWLELAANALLSLKENRKRRLWFFFDELASLQRLPSLEPLLSRGRGYGACFVGALQDYHQLCEIYGTKAAEALVSLFGTNIFFSTNNNASARWAAEQLGRAEFLEIKEGYSMGAHLIRDGVTLNHQRRQELIVMDSEIRHLKKLEAYMVTSGGWPVTKLHFKPRKRQELHEAFCERDLKDLEEKIKSVEESNASDEKPETTISSEASAVLLPQDNHKIDLF